jgi:hypothetical protein
MPRSAATDVDVPAFTAADVAVRADKGGRVVFVIPDPVARALRRAGKAGWVEVLGMGDGAGHRYPPGTRVHAAATVLLDVARELPNDVDIDAETRERTLQAAGFGALAAFVVGRAGWDDAARWSPTTTPPSSCTCPAACTPRSSTAPCTAPVELSRRQPATRLLARRDHARPRPPTRR